MDLDCCRSRRRAVFSLLIFVLATCTVFAEEGIMVLVVTDTEQHPFANVQIGTAGDGGSPQFTDQNGKARLKLPPSTKPAAWVTLLLMNAPNGWDLAFISPFDSRVRVPPFDNESDNYDPVVLAKRGDKSMLESGSGMLAVHAAMNQSAAQKKKSSAPSSHEMRQDPVIRGYGAPRLQLATLSEGQTPAFGQDGPAMQENAPQLQDVTAKVDDCASNVSAQRRELEKHILVLINEQRQKQGLAPLDANDPLASVARHHSCRMMALNFFSHVDPELGDTSQRLRSAKLHVTSASENLAEEKSPSDAASRAIELWLSDADHSENMLDNEFGCAGVGVAIRPDETYLVTEISSTHPCPQSGLPGEEQLDAASRKFGLPLADIKIALKKWGGTNLTWKIVALKTSLGNGTDPFTAVRASSSDIVFGIGSWSVGDCTLQPLLVKFQDRDSKRFAEIIGTDTAWLSKAARVPCTVSSKAALARMINSSSASTRLWRRRFRKLGEDPTFQHVQMEQMTLLVEKAQSQVSSLRLESEQAVAFWQEVVMLHEGTLRTKLQQDYQRDLTAFSRQTGQQPDEEVRLLVLMNRSIQWNNARESKSAAEKAQFDSKARLLAEGNGEVSGRHYDLDDYGIGLTETRTGLEVHRRAQAATLEKLAGGWIPGQGRPATAEKPLPR